MFNFIKKQRKALRLCVLVPLIGILTLELLLRLGSSSALFRGLVARRFSSEQAHCRIDWLRVSLFSGVLAEGLHLDLDSPLGRLEFQAREAMYRIRLHKVFSKALSLKNLRFRHAELSLLNEAGHPILRCRQLAFSARLQNPQQLALMLSFRQHGIRVNGAALLDNASELPTLLARRPAGKERDYQKVLALLEKFQAYFEHCEFGENDTRLALTAALTCAVGRLWSWTATLISTTASSARSWCKNSAGVSSLGSRSLSFMTCSGFLKTTSVCRLRAASTSKVRM